MANRISKNPKAVQKPSKHDFPFEIVHQIAYKLLVELKSVETTARELNLPVLRVRNIREAKSQSWDWIDAIADLGRKGLIE